MLIRPSVADDVDRLRELWRATWRHAYASRLGPDGDDVIGASLDGEAIRSMFAADGGCLVAVDGDEIVGSLCFAERGVFAYVWGMYVDPSRQRSGIGTALIRRFARDVRRAERVDLSAVDERALAFYRKLGFVAQGAGDFDLFPAVRVSTTRLVASVRDLRLSPPT